MIDRNGRPLKLKGLDSSNDFFWDDKTGTAKFIKGRLTKPSNDESEIIARSFLEDNTGLLDAQGIFHTWIADLRVLLIFPSGDEVVLHDQSGRCRHDIKMIYSTTTDESLLAQLGSGIQGNWQVKVVDTYSRDAGTLNSWCIYLCL